MKQKCPICGVKMAAHNRYHLVAFHADWQRDSHTFTRQCRGCGFQTDLFNVMASHFAHLTPEQFKQHALVEMMVGP